MRIVADRGMKKGDSVVIDLELYRSGSRVGHCNQSRALQACLYSNAIALHVVCGDFVLFECGHVHTLLRFPMSSQEPLQGATRKSYQFDTGKANAAFLPGVIEASMSIKCLI